MTTSNGSDPKGDVDATPSAARALRRRVAAIAAAAALFGGAAFALGWVLKPPTRLTAAAYGGERVHVINAHIRQAAPGYGFLAGDSFVEHYAAEPLPCGRELVNGGVNGAKVADYLHLLDAVQFERTPSVVLLSTGLNDLQIKYDPTGEAALGRFRANATRLIDRLVVGGASVVVAAIPPIQESVAKYFDTRSFALYSDALQAICRDRGCTFVDPFAAVRDGPFWRGKPGSSRDGLHLANLREAYRSIYGVLCR